MRLRLAFWAVLMLCVLLARSVCAGEIRTGQVLYAADFSAYTSLRDTGLRFGTLSGEASAMRLENGELLADSRDGEKTYLLLPDPGLHTDTYVWECVLRFRDIQSSRGYCGLILSSRGDAPSGRTELILRADGTVDGYKGVCPELKTAAEKGEPITVRVHVTYGFLVDFRLLIGGETVRSYTPDALSRVSAGGQGIVLRNTSAAFQSMRVVAGDHADLENAPETPSYIAPADWQLPEDVSPPTGDAAACCAASALLSGAYVVRMRRRRV